MKELAGLSNAEPVKSLLTFQRYEMTTSMGMSFKLGSLLLEDRDILVQRVAVCFWDYLLFCKQGLKCLSRAILIL